MNDTRKVLRNKGGFTLIEVLTVTAILAIGAAVTVWSINLILPDLRLKAAVRDLKSDMNLARLRAVRENQVVTVKFDPAPANTYTVFLDDGSGASATAGNGIQEGNEATIRTVSLPKSVGWVSSNAVSFSGDAFLRYDSLGRPLHMGHVRMANSKPTYRGVAVNFTGNVAIKKSDDGVDDDNHWETVE